MPPPRSVGSRRSSGAAPEVNDASSRRQHVGDPVQSTASRSRHPSVTRTGYEVPDSFLNVTEVTDAPPIQDQNELFGLDSHSIQELASRHQTSEDIPRRRESLSERQYLPSRQQPDPEVKAEIAVSKWTTELYTVSYLILFAIFGTLARLGLQALTSYPSAPVPFSSVWPNFAGSLVIGFLAEDRKLFRFEWGTPTDNQQLAETEKDEESRSPSSQRVAQDLATQKKVHLAFKKTIPLYIGLATGFCGSFTSFSSFIRDIFLALSNDLPMPDGAATPRNGGYSFLALLAVTITTISLSFSGFYLGGQLAIALEPVTPSLSYALTCKYVDPLAVVLAWGSWIGAVILSIVPPDRYSSLGASEFWRGRATFALVFAPLGCLVRFYASARLNGRVASFPLGTFAVNIMGTAVLGLAWDLAHVPEGGVVGCQVLQGIEDGFCGCLTTVSTWIMELAVLRHRKAYVYGGVSVISALALMVAIMGGLRWSQEFSELLCLH
ncbi:CrcB-like protein-domain-containing protein [Xylariaceae sp. AK1471]|nr:CrcB-like protein-domain-containing protein [Xylariaceae sp. AK1471]